MKDFWGNDDDDLAVDKTTPLLIKMLAMTVEILDVDGNVRDSGLSDSLNVIDIQERLIDVLAGAREYQKKREKELKGDEDEEEQ